MASSNNTNFQAVKTLYISNDIKLKNLLKLDINVKNFLEIFHHEYIRQKILLEHVFNNQYENIMKYIDLPNRFDFNKYNKCTKFFNEYSDYLGNNYSGELGYNYLCIVMTTVLEYFGGLSEYEKIVKYAEKIHNEHIGRGLILLHNIHPNLFPKFKKVTTSFFKSYMILDFCHKKIDYYLIYNNNRRWSLENDDNVLVNNESIEKIIEYIALIF